MVNLMSKQYIGQGVLEEKEIRVALVVINADSVGLIGADDPQHWIKR